jgi:hypothetical protein
MKMDVRIILLAGAACLVIAGRSRAATITVETHDSWGMVCYPTNGPAFLVAVSGSRRRLAIKSTRGNFIRQNIITRRRTDASGFTITAVGTDHNGESRVIEAHFGPDGGTLDVVDRDDPPVQCGPDKGISDD